MIDLLDRNKLYYLASPYSSPDPKVQRHRKREITRIAAKLTELHGIALICPITTSAQLKIANPKLGTCWSYWGQVDTIFVKKSDVLLVAMMPGWKESTGVQAEIQIAKSNKKPILYLAPDTLDIYTSREFDYIYNGGE